MLSQLAGGGQDGDLRHAFVQLDAYVYHSLASCLGEVCGPLSGAYFRLGRRPTQLWHHQSGHDQGKGMGG
jgi:hypothetical protein